MNNVIAIQTNHYPRMTELARTFPTLDGADGVEPFDPDKLDANRGLSHGGLYAVQFLLSVWHGRMGHKLKRTKTYRDGDDIVEYGFSLRSPWKVGPFDVVDAMGTWDHAHRAAFVAWAKDPWP